MKNRTIGGRVKLAALSALLAAHVAAQTSALTPAPARREVTDEVGRRVSLPLAPQRIVSLSPNLTETIFALGAQEKLAGVTDFCDFPPEARQKTRVGGAISPNLEQIVALKPDLVLATTALNRKVTVEELERLGVSVYATKPRRVRDVIASLERLGQMIGAEERGATLAASLRSRLAELEQRLAGRAPRTVLFIVWADPLITIGPETFIADALRYAGARSAVETTQDWPRLSLEEAVRLQPEFLVFADTHSESVETRVRDLSERPGWRSLEAVQQKRVAIVSDAISRPAPRLVDAIEQLARQLHPTAFGENGNWKMEKGREQRVASFELAIHAADSGLSARRPKPLGNIQFPISGFQFPFSSGERPCSR
jgi:iron complex transport system substrate-binding protein